MRVLAAMSGGVDSSVAAALMGRQGHEVIGVTLKLWEGPGGEAPTAGCCTVADAEDARRVAAQLDIPYYVFDYTDDFLRGVVDRFVDDYANGRTPNPCVECNRVVKFDLLLRRAAELGCGLVVTGHYARVHEGAEGYELWKGLDQNKDQSYVLYMLGQEELARVRFPVGSLTKSETRRHASELGLRTAHKPDSQDICFVGDRDYRDFVREQRPNLTRAGVIVDPSGVRLGEHRGVIDFTVGQRRGLGLSVGEPRYVIDVQPEAQTVVVGTRKDLLAAGCTVGDVSWIAGSPPDSGTIQVKIRYRSAPVGARLEPAPALVPAGLTPGGDGQRWDAWFDRPQPAVAPGQSAVFYRDERVLGGGVITSRLR